MKPVIIIAILAVGAVLGVLLTSSQDIENRSMPPKADELFYQYASYVDHRHQFLSAWENEKITDQEYMQELKKLEINLLVLKEDYFAKDWAPSELFDVTDVTDFIEEIRGEIESIEILQMIEDAAISEQNVSIPDTQNNCDPSYPDVCITSYPPDLDCGEIGYSNFRVVGSDPHGFDRDNDGIGCESG